MELWQRLSTRAKIGMGISLVCILGFATGLGLWAYRTDYHVLFADLSNGDAASMVAELERLKTPYQLTDGGKTILVPQELVYKTRLKVMGKELPLHGAVGFEVFNNADFGMTEFVQKVNYQRAVQGELTRTILSMDDVQSARVHLAIPEQGLFKKALSKPKASVTLVMKPGRVLEPDQVKGIARLVAASVPDMQIMDVTILDQHGVSLTKASTPDGAVESAQSQLDSKRSMEEYLLKKVGAVLDNMFGAGAAIASVDVVLNLDQSKVTTEDVLPARGAAVDGVPTGVVVRERQSAQNAGGSAALGAASASGGTREGGNGNSSVEADYQVGRRVEQLAVAPGSLRRMTVAVVVKKNLDAAQLDHLKEVVSLTLGLNPQRGDGIVIQSMEHLITAAAQGKEVAVVAGAAGAQEAGGGKAGLTLKEEYQPPVKPARVEKDNLWLFGLLVALVLLAMIVWRVLAGGAAPQPRFAQPMSQLERDRLLQDVKQWIMQGNADDIAGSRK